MTPHSLFPETEAYRIRATLSKMIATGSYEEALIAKYVKEKMVEVSFNELLLKLNTHILRGDDMFILSQEEYGQLKIYTDTSDNVEYRIQTKENKHFYKGIELKIINN